MAEVCNCQAHYIVNDWVHLGGGCALGLGQVREYQEENQAIVDGGKAKRRPWSQTPPKPRLCPGRAFQVGWAGFKGKARCHPRRLWGQFGLPFQAERLSWGLEPGAPRCFASVYYRRDLRSGSSRREKAKGILEGDVEPFLFR